ncbi:hypothetical protein L2E82_05941 [Cichorium intybus]|uniref:Uncharacterized protein n=1 Tax=Cichorium intybus TaxID=13427 RepID=A0ACB9HA09_CICIN|nr:hypothetical protein L2E82_05941 [Cichorium intybus]
MRTSSNEVHEHRVGFSNRNDFNRRTPSEINRSSPFTISTGPNSFTPSLPAKRSSWKSLSFGKFSSKPIRLSIVKLDGSSFDIVVKKRATVAKVKKAIEAAFTHMSTPGDDEISWSHVWGNFCLCFENMKLFRDRDSITRFGIKNGDQLQFVRHTPIYEVAGERLEKITIDSNQPNGPIHIRIKIGNLNRSSSKRDLKGDMKKIFRNNRSNHNRVRNEVNRSSWVYKMRGLFSTRNDRVGHSTVTLGRWFPSSDDDDDDDSDDANISCRLFNEFAGGLSECQCNICNNEISLFPQLISLPLIIIIFQSLYTHNQQPNRSTTSVFFTAIVIL